MKNVKPMLGAMTICGKDSLGRKLILPTDHEKVKKFNILTANKKRPSWIKRLVNVFKGRKITHDEKEVVVKISKRRCDAVRSEYMVGVSERIEKIQHKIKQEKREIFMKAMGL